MSKITLNKGRDLSDENVDHFLCDLLEKLRESRDSFPTDSMNEEDLFLQGQKDMLEQFISLFENERTYSMNLHY